MTRRSVYCFDTSAFLEGSTVRPYPTEIFPTLWEKLADLVTRRRIISAEEVLLELQRKADAVAAWAEARDDLFVRPEARLQSAFLKVMSDHPGLVDVRRGRGGADPWVIALARMTDGGVVVSQEARHMNRVTIPTACDSYRVACITLTEVLRREGWTF